jgi:hypothetical protein
MPEVKLGTKKFDEDSEVIDACFSKVSGAECAALGAGMAAGKFKRLKKLKLVRFFGAVFAQYFRRLFCCCEV